MLQATIFENIKHHAFAITKKRLSTVQNADQIIVIDKGQVLETGNHSDLMKTRGSYFNLISRKVSAWIDHQAIFKVRVAVSLLTSASLFNVQMKFLF